jgi:hypothetical protein
MPRYLQFLFFVAAIAGASPATHPPARFEPANAQGSQWTAQGFGYGAQFAPSHIELAGGLRMELVGASPLAAMRGEELLPAHSSYFRGADPRQWRKNVPQFSRLRASGVYRGVDVEYYRGAHGLESDFIVAAGADPSQIQLQFKGRRLTVDDLGSLRDRDKGEVLLAAPIAYQTSADGRRQIVASEFRTLGDRVRFRVGNWDHSRGLIIDPVLTYATFLGGSGRDSMVGIERGPDGSFYVLGTTTSVDLPQAVSIGSLLNRPVVLPQPDVFVAHYSADGSQLLYVVYVGGDMLEAATSLAVDALGRATVSGYSYSTNFPTTPGVPIGSLGFRGFDAFVFRLSADGSALEYSTFLGIISPTAGYLSPSPLPPILVGIDSSGAPTIAGTAVINYNYQVISITPTKGALQSQSGGVNDAFLIRLSADGKSIQWATYYGGSGAELVLGLAVDPAGSVYLVGQTNSNDLPLSHPFQSSPPSPAAPPGLFGTAAGFFAKITSDGGSLMAASYLGGQQASSTLTSVAVDETGAVYLAGGSSVSATPGLISAPGPTPEYPNGNAALVKLDATASIPQYMWGYGYLTASAPLRVRVDASHKPCILANFFQIPTTPGALPANPEGYPENGFACFSSDGQTLQLATNPPGFGFSFTTADFTIDPDGTLTGAASTTATDATLPVTSTATQPNPGNGLDGYIFRISVQNQSPQLFYVNPPVLYSTNNPPFVSITLVGANFSRGMTVLLNGAPLTTLSGVYLPGTLAGFNLTTAQLAQLPLGSLSFQLSVPGPGGGVSPAVTMKYVNPQPGVVAISPAAVKAGSSDTTFNVSATLANGCTVTWNGVAQPFTAAPFGGLQFTMPASALATAGSAVVVTNPSPGGGSSSAQVSITATGLPSQIPTITGSVLVGVGEGGITQTMSVSNVQTGATVVWNGADRPTTLVSSSTLQFALSLSDLSQMGSAQVQVRSAGVLGPAVTAYVGLRAVNSNVIADAVRGQAYFITRNASSQIQSIASVSVPSGAVLRTMDMGAPVLSMAKTDDNAYLWVITLDGRIRRVNIDTFAVDTTATVPGGQNPAPTFTLPAAVAVAGSSSTVVAAGVDGVLRIFDKGVQRGFSSAQMIPAPSTYMVPVFATPNVVWANIGYGTSCLVRLEYDYTGFSSFSESCGNGITGPWALPSPEVKIDAGVTYFQSGTRTQVWYSPLGGAVDLVNRRVVSLSLRATPGNNTSLYGVGVYDLDSDAQIASVTQSGFVPFSIIVPFNSSEVLLSSSGILLLVGLQ